MHIQTLRINPFNEFDRVQDIWTSLESESPSVSFFNSWGWVSTWLTCLPNNLTLDLIVNVENDVPVCCFFLGATYQTENKFKKSRGFLNSTGFEKYDDLVIEYNSLLCPKHDINHQLAIALASLNNIEEFRFSHTTNIDFDHFQDYFQRSESNPSYWVNLKDIDPEKGYLSYLSKNKRNQIKRSIKAYESTSELKIEFATDIAQAKSFFKNLEILHQQEWIKRGKSGAFAEPFFKTFHDKLISTRFEQGEIQLIRIFNDEEDVGYLYNFVFNNDILFYQSGFNYKADNKFRPGIVSHYLAITQCLEKGFNKYNFLVGKTQYKESLSTHSDILYSVVLSRKTVKSRIENTLRKIQLLLK